MNIIPAFIQRRIANRPNLIKIAYNVAWLFFDKVLRMGVGLLLGVWVARYLAPEQFGLLNFAISFVGLFGFIAGLGVQGIVVRDIVYDPATARLTLGTAAVLQFVGGLVSYALILATIAYLRPDDALARSIVAILGATMLFKASEIATYWFESQVQSKYTVWVQNGAFLLFAAVKVTLILSNSPLIAFVWAMLAEAGVVALVLMVVLGLRGPIIASLRVSTERARTLLKDSWPLIISSMAGMIYLRTDQIMIGEMLGNHSVGLYSAAVRLVEIWYAVAIILASSFFPVLIQSKQIDGLCFENRLRKLLTVMVYIGLIITLSTTFLSDKIIIILYGEEYAASSRSLAISSWAIPFVFMGAVINKWFVAENLQNLAYNRFVVGAMLNIFLNFMLIPEYGIDGSAWATLVSQITANMLWNVLSDKTRKLFWLQWHALSWRNLR